MGGACGDSGTTGQVTFRPVECLILAHAPHHRNMLTLAGIASLGRFHRSAGLIKSGLAGTIPNGRLGSRCRKFYRSLKARVEQVPWCAKN
jgi:hypothetical protein